MKRLIYLLRILINIFRFPVLFLVFLGRLRFSFIQLISIKSKLFIEKKGKIILKGKNVFEAASFIHACGGKICIDNAFINRNCVICSMGNIEIHSGVTIGPNTCIYDHNHAKDSGNSKNQYDIGEVIIGKNVWIGANCVILKGVHIGDNAIIGAGSVVTKDIESDSVAFGAPAVEKRKVFKNVKTI